MIRIILGLQGSGKTLTATKKIIDSQELCYTNFNVRSPEVIRLKYDMLLKYNEKNRPIAVNWTFGRQPSKSTKILTSALMNCNIF